VIGDTELLSNGIVGFATDKKGAQSKVAAVERLARFDKELTTAGVIHDGNSGLRVNYRIHVQLHRKADQSHFQWLAAAGSEMHWELPRRRSMERQWHPGSQGQTHSEKRQMTGGKSPSRGQEKLRDLADIASSKPQH
jgi:hypothetical protein